jgi:uncharacterized protein (DUF983 family)
MIHGQSAMSTFFILSPLDLEKQDEQAPKSVSQLQVGNLCPACGKAYLDYNGLLNLICFECGYTLSGSFT